MPEIDEQSDNAYGPLMPGGVCPDTTGPYKREVLVGSFAEFDAAYQAALPGDAIIIRNGTYNWTANVSESTKYSKATRRPYDLNRSGTLLEPIYILPESLHGVHFKDSRIGFVFSGEHQIMAGFRITNPDKMYVAAPNNRIACNYFTEMAATAYVVVKNQDADRVEIDNNVFDGGAFNALVLWRCNPELSSCTKNSKGAHIHHNTFKNKPYMNGVNAHEAIVLGLGYSPVPGVTIHNADGSNMDAIVENNLFDGWDGENELITIKSSRNIIRNNCVINSPHSNFKIRFGDDNLITGNWMDAGNGIEISGKRSVVAFNYYARANNGFRLHTGEQYAQGYKGSNRLDNLYAYIDASDSILRYNVLRGTSYLVISQKQLGHIFIAQTANTLIADNHIYSSKFVGNNAIGGYHNADGLYSESAFRGNNQWGDNTVFSYELSDASCGDKDLFDGPGGAEASIVTPATLLGGERTIRPPSWW